MPNNKSEGSYYTPFYIADFMIKLCEDVLNTSERVDILEPSCGDGVFIKALLNKKDFQYREKITFCGVERDNQELSKAKTYKKNLKQIGINSSFYNQDFLDFCLLRKRKFDVIIGNPPYINKKYILPEQVIKIKDLLIENNMPQNIIYNIWIAFIIGSLRLLKNDGILCFVLPAEMLQVKYAEPITKLINDEFEEIKIYSFEERVFQNIEQDVIILFCKKKSKKKLITFSKLDKDLNLVKAVENVKSKEVPKWSWYVLNPEEMDLIDRIKNKFNTIDHYCKSGAGIVTGNNEYFILKPSQVNQFELQDYVQPILKKSSYISSTLKFTESEFQKIHKENLPCYLLDFNNTDSREMSVSAKKYIQNGKKLKVNEGYKCSIRNRWYEVPSIWQSEGFFFKRSHLYPKIILNTTGVNVTDTAYRIEMKEKYDLKTLIFCFYNSLTLIDSELMGRSYGGGVLEITPNEFKKIKIPYTLIEEKDFDYLNEMFKLNTPIDQVLEFTDKVILIERFRLDYEEVQMLKEIRQKLIGRRVL